MDICNCPLFLRTMFLSFKLLTAKEFYFGHYITIYYHLIEYRGITIIAMKAIFDSDQQKIPKQYK